MNPQPKKKTRGGHRLNVVGQCVRCGLGRNDNGKRCPPGFWMTQRELAVWGVASDAARNRLEVKLSRDRSTSVQPDPVKP